MQRRHLYIHISNNTPKEIKFFLDRQAGLKYLIDQSGDTSDWSKIWSDEKRCGEVRTDFGIFWLYEVEVY